MRFLYLTIKFLPYWGIPTSLILLEVALMLRKRGNKKLFVRLAYCSFLTFAVVVLFFVFRWDMTLYPWLKERIQPQ